MLEAEHQSAMEATVEHVAASLEEAQEEMLAQLWRTMSDVLGRSVRASWSLTEEAALRREALEAAQRDHRKAQARRAALLAPPSSRRPPRATCPRRLCRHLFRTSRRARARAAHPPRRLQEEMEEALRLTHG